MQVTKSNSLEAESYLKKLLNEGARTPVDSEFSLDKQRIPDWYDEELFKKGQKYFRKNIFAFFLGMLCGLMSVLTIPTIAKVLICTKKSSNSFAAYKRYIRTIFHITAWNYYDLNKDSKTWKSLCSVRRTHLRWSKVCQKSQENLFISQKDMALTQFGFMGYITLKAHQLGITESEEYLEATIHFWRVIGYMIGILDEYNLCTESWDTTKPRLKRILQDVYQPALLTPDENILDMMNSMISGLWSFNPFLSMDTFFYFTKRLAECNGYQYLKEDFNNWEVSFCIQNENLVYKNFSLWNRMMIFVLVMLHRYVLRITLFRIYFNFQMYISLFLIYYFPFLAYPRFGFKNSYIRIFY